MYFKSYGMMILFFFLLVGTITFIMNYPKMALEMASLCGLPAPIRNILAEFLPEDNEVIIKKEKNGYVKCSNGERECRRYLEDKYGVPFPNTRPDWLINPKTKRKLEIDCYNEDMKLGVEYNGIQHYEWPNFTKQTFDKFKDQVYRDRQKRKICRERGIKLITVGYEVKVKDIGDHIEKKLKRMNM